MLPLFHKSVAKIPEALQSPNTDSVCALKDGFLAQNFSSTYPASVTINLGCSGFIAYSSDKQNPLFPRPFLINELQAQDLLHDRRKKCECLERYGIPVPRPSGRLFC